jgi:hypothetical protein
MIIGRHKTGMRPASRLGPETGFSNRGSLLFSSGSPGGGHDCTLKLGHGGFLPNSFQLIIRSHHFI